MSELLFVDVNAPTGILRLGEFVQIKIRIHDERLIFVIQKCGFAVSMANVGSLAVVAAPVRQIRLTIVVLSPEVIRTGNVQSKNQIALGVTNEGHALLGIWDARVRGRWRLENETVRERLSICCDDHIWWFCRRAFENSPWPRYPFWICFDLDIGLTWDALSEAGRQST
jgi:hypothetical protein